MNILIIILLVILGLVAMLFILALFAKKEYVIDREITINKPRNKVFDYVKHLKNQDHYSKWVMTDPDMKKDFIGTDGTEGFIYSWDGNKKAGKGEQEITRIKEGERIDMEVRFIRPFEGVADTFMTTRAVSENQTTVKWVFGSSMKYPMNAMLLLMNMEKMLGKDLEISLANLKSNLEKQ